MRKNITGRRRTIRENDIDNAGVMHSGNEISSNMAFKRPASVQSCKNIVVATDTTGGFTINEY